MTSFADDATMIRDGEPYREFDDGRIRVFGYSYDAMALSQITTGAGHGWVSDAALMADNHLGYSMPIGGVAGYRDMVSPSGVGYDIGAMRGRSSRTSSIRSGVRTAITPRASRSALTRWRTLQPAVRRHGLRASNALRT